MAAAVPAITAIAGVASAGAGLYASLKKPSMPDTPKPVPLPDMAAADAVRRRRLADQSQRSGFASTMLTTPSTRTTLG